MSFKCAIQMIGLVRGNPNGKKHRANGKAILGEMGVERTSHSATLDRSLSPNNIYIGEYDSGYATWDKMVHRADEYRQPIERKNKDGSSSIHYRALRQDAVIGVATIINPPFEECQNWTRQDYDKFYQDSFDVLHEILPDIFRVENRRLRAIHVDEGLPTGPDQIYDEHVHDVYDCIDETGHYCGNRIDGKFLSELNSIYPKRMRYKGWDMENLDTTDWHRFYKDSEYREERKEKARLSGLSVNDQMYKKAVSTLAKAHNILLNASQTAANQEQLQLQLDETEQAQKAMQVALDNTDIAHQQNIATYEAEKQAYIKRYSTLYAGVQGILKKLPESVSSHLQEVLMGAQALDDMDRFGIKRIEQDLENSRTAYDEAKKRLDFALADERAQTRMSRVLMSKSCSDDVSVQVDEDRELEF